MTHTLPLAVVFRSAWGVSTGTGIAGGVDSIVEKDAAGRPVVRGTVLTGVIRERAVTAAQALDDGATDGPWSRFARDLFGPGPDDDGQDDRRQRHVIFSDATVAGGRDVPVHEVVSLSIDDETGTAREDFLRFFERAGACRLQGTVTLVDEDAEGRNLTWSDEQRDAARLLLALSGLLVRGIGSNRSDGDGVCDVLIGADPARQADDGELLTKVRTWCSTAMDRLAPEAAAVPAATAAVVFPRVAAQTASSAKAEPLPGGNHASTAPCSPQWWSTTLTIDLLTPVVSYDVPMSNEVRSLDFLRGTVMLPWVHRLLRRALTGNGAIRDAVVHGRLLVSDALPVAGDIVGLPTPLVLSTPKVRKPDQRWRQVTNRLVAEEPQEVHSPLRSGFIFPGWEAPPSEPPGEGSRPDDELSGGLGAPPLTGRQATAHSAATGAAKDGALFLVRALPAGLRLRATVTLSKDLADVPGVREALAAGSAREARLGSRRLSGAYGHATCTFSPLTKVTAPPVSTGETTLWFTSDVLARSAALGPGGSQQDLVNSFGRAGARIEVCPASDDRFTAGIRHRRVDSWSAAGGQPRPTRTAIQAGSVLRVLAPDEAAARALADLSVTGVGDLTAQGFGRFVIGHPLLDQKRFLLRDLHRTDFINPADVAASQEEQS